MTDQIYISLRYQRYKTNMLLAGILLDAVGAASYFLPLLGETADIYWAPVAAIIYFLMYRGIRGMLGGAFVFIEELLPFTDIIPSFTLTWLFVFVLRDNQSRKHFFRKMESQSLQ